MKQLATCLVALTMASGAAAQRTADYHVVPLPSSIQPDEATAPFALTSDVVIVTDTADKAMATNARLLTEYLRDLTGLQLDVRPEATSAPAIRLNSGAVLSGPEAYRLSVGPQAVSIDGATPAGVFYGIQTLRKSIPAGGTDAVSLPAVTVTDSPRFAYRGAHLDVARHFFTADSVKRFIDMMALHNINHFHWHITDDQGWRVEIKSRPQLTVRGSVRPQTVVGPNTGTYDGIPHGGFYTQDQVRDIISYAADRHITVIPEIDMPGHMQAALAAYSELGCTGGPYEVWQRWGISDDVLCAGNDSVYAFIDDVLTEITELFPSKYVHIGGDECPKTRWKECPKCQQRIAELGLKDDEHFTAEQKLQSHVMAHATQFLASKGRRTIGWDEILEGNVAPGSIIMSWRGVKGGRQAALAGHDAIMTPCTHLYFDFYQFKDHEGEPLAASWSHPVELVDVYGYEPVPDDLTPEQARHIIGVQANLWAEYIPTFSHAEYMELPRMGALAEVQWCAGPKDFDGFKARLRRLAKHYGLAGYNYCRRAVPQD